MQNSSIQFFDFMLWSRFHIWVKLFSTLTDIFLDL